MHGVPPITDRGDHLADRGDPLWWCGYRSAHDCDRGALRGRIERRAMGYGGPRRVDGPRVLSRTGDSSRGGKRLGLDRYIRSVPLISADCADRAGCAGAGVDAEGFVAYVPRPCTRPFPFPRDYRYRSRSGLVRVATPRHLWFRCRNTHRLRWSVGLYRPDDARVLYSRRTLILFGTAMNDLETVILTAVLILSWVGLVALCSTDGL